MLTPTAKSLTRTTSEIGIKGPRPPLSAVRPNTKDEFASHLLNLTLASPSVNRHQKSDKDAAKWLRGLNQSWYVNRVIQVRLE